VVLEAMAAGCPIVAPKAGGIPSLLTHDETGLLFNPGNLAEAVNGTRTLLTDEGTRLRLGHAARAAVEGRDWQISTGRVRQVYAKAIAAGRRQAARWTWRDRLAQATTNTLVAAFRTASGRKKPMLPQPASIAPALPEFGGEPAPHPALA